MDFTSVDMYTMYMYSTSLLSGWYSKYTDDAVSGKASRETSRQHLAKPNPFFSPPQVYKPNQFNKL